MKEWLKESWDKLLGAFAMIVIAAVVGYFSGIRATEQDIADVQERVRALETYQDSVTKPHASLIDDLEATDLFIRQRIESLNDRVALQNATRMLIEEQQDLTRLHTATALRRIINEHQ